MTNPLRVWARLAVYALLALLGACTTLDQPTPTLAPRVIQSPGKPTVMVSERQDGASIVLDASQELRVELPNDAWAVTHDLEWSVADLSPGVLGVLGSRFERGARDNNPSDAGGSTIWRIKPQAAGQVKLKFVLRRARSLDPATQTVTFDVTVR